MMQFTSAYWHNTLTLAYHGNLRNRTNKLLYWSNSLFFMSAGL